MSTSKSPSEGRVYLSIREIADDLGISTYQARMLVRRKMDHLRIGLKTIRVDREEYERFKAQAKVKGGSMRVR